MTEEESHMRDILIRAPDGALEHKRAGNVPRTETPYWTVQGTPRNTEAGQHIWFERDGQLIATGYITEVEEGRVWFTPLEAIERPSPTNATTRGFKYIGPLDRHFPQEGPGNYFGDCVVCGCEEGDFETGMAVGELTLSDVNYGRLDHGLGPVCSRPCMLGLGFDALPWKDINSLRIDERFCWRPGER